MNWLVLITISLIAYSFATIVQKMVLNYKNINPVSFSILFQSICGVLFLTAALYFGTLDIQGLIDFLPFIILVSIMYAAANFFGFLSLKEVDASKYTVIFSSRGLFTVIASTIFLGESLDSTIKILGMALIILGVIIVTVEKLDKSFFKFTKYEIFGMLAALFIGLCNTTDSYLLKSIDTYTYTASVFIFPGIILFATSKEGRKNLKPLFNPDSLIRIVVFSILIFISAFAFFSALAIHNSAEVASVNLLSTIVVVVLGIIILNERKNILRKLVGALVSVGGLLLITLG